MFDASEGGALERSIMEEEWEAAIAARGTC